MNIVDLLHRYLQVFRVVLPPLAARAEVEEREERPDYPTEEPQTVESKK